ncbi:methyltransferase [Candidatus Saccharibacteria bacterium]|nr:methyltransferase [Candidatus Saccharibacteria bacterium]
MLQKFSKEIFSDPDVHHMSIPEFVAEHMANRLNNYDSAVELCSGVGMLCVILAKQINHVTGIDINADRINMSQKNAELYGVSKKTGFVLGDVLAPELLKKQSAEVVILDPDWREGGPKGEFPPLLEKTNPSSKTLFDLAKRWIAPNIVIRAPKTIPVDEFNKYGACEIENVIWDGSLKFKIAYYTPNMEQTIEKEVVFEG